MRFFCYIFLDNWFNNQFIVLWYYIKPYQMKKLLLLVSLTLPISIFSQTTIFEDDFQSGAGNWTLNTGSGSNQWIVNSAYVGFSGIVDDTPAQPNAITGSPNSSYLHIHNVPICGAVAICNGSFDTGSPSDQYVAMTNSISTTNYSNVTLTFYYLSAGASGTSYGTLEYSTNNGGNWTPTGTSYQGISTWTLATVSLPAFNNVAQLKFRFRWQNGASGVDPAFCIDQLKIVATAGGGASIVTNNITTTSWCFNTQANITVPFTVTGAVNAGNVYTAQLSDAAGSFAFPVNLGTLASTSTGSLSINGIAQAALPVGNGYRIRVIASNPPTVGTDNGSNISILSLPNVAIVPNPSNGTVCLGSSVVMLATGASTYNWSPPIYLDITNQAQVTSTPTLASATQYTAVGFDVNGCGNTATFTVTAQDCGAGISENNDDVFSIYPIPTNNVVYIQQKTSAKISSIDLLDVAGRRIKQISPNGNAIDMSDLSVGNYFVRIIYDDGIIIKKIIKD